MNEVECAWVAGLLEGEGSFGLGPEGNRKSKPAIRSLRVTCGMTDKDTILKLHKATGVGNVSLERRIDPRRAYAKQMYVWHASKRADVINLLDQIRPHMSERRGVKIDELLRYAAEHPPIYSLPVVCGTRRAYRKGCRCSDCREAENIYARDLAQRKRDEKAKNQAV